jgi:hypothetical protein
MELPAELPKKQEMPQVALNVNVAPGEVNIQLVQPEEIVSLVKTVMTDIEGEKHEIQEALVNFSEMVFNAGDATSASKEALVNLLKLKSDLIDKKARMLEMMMKVYKTEGPKTVTAHQHNDIYVHDKRKLFDELDKEEKKDK